MWLRLSGFAIALGLGLGMVPAQAQITDSQVNTLVEVLRLNAPPASASGERLYGEWKVKADNIPRWSQKCIGRTLTPELFAASPLTARWILACVVRDTLQTELKASGNNEAVAIRRTAAWWMTGKPERYATGETGPYTQQVLTAYQQKKPVAAKPPTAKSTSTKPAPATEGTASAIAPGAPPAEKQPNQATPADSKPPATSEATPTPVKTTVYDRYMQAGYDATKKRDQVIALLYFRRALDERPGDSYATQAIQNLEGSARNQAPPTTASTPSAATPSNPSQAPTSPATETTPSTAAANFPSPSPALSPATVTKPTPLPKPKPAAATATKPATPPSSLPTVAVPSVAPVSATLTQQEAVDLVNRWLQAKADIFAPPFDQQQALNLTTGELLSALMKPDGVLSWLKSNRAYYRYGVQKVDSINRFLAVRDRATLEITITEDRTLYLNGAVDPKRTDFSAQRIRFSLEAIDGTWKIADYKTVDGSLLERSVGKE